MRIKKTTKKDNYYEILVEMGIFGETHEATFIGTHDTGLATRMCDACPLHEDCFIKDTIKYELCCFLELLYQTPLPNVDLGVLYMKPESALEIKKIIDSGLEIEEDEEESKEEIIVRDEEPKPEPESKPIFTFL